MPRVHPAHRARSSHYRVWSPATMSAKIASSSSLTRPIATMDPTAMIAASSEVLDQILSFVLTNETSHEVLHLFSPLRRVSTSEHRRVPTPDSVFPLRRGIPISVMHIPTSNLPSLEPSDDVIEQEVDFVANQTHRDDGPDRDDGREQRGTRSNPGRFPHERTAQKCSSSRISLTVDDWQDNLLPG